MALPVNLIIHVLLSTVWLANNLTIGILPWVPILRRFSRAPPRVLYFFYWPLIDRPPRPTTTAFGRQATKTGREKPLVLRVLAFYCAYKIRVSRFNRGCDFHCRQSP